jgi:glycosyltransferase involved in cell wall biosynthesis
VSVVHCIYDAYSQSWPSHGPFDASNLAGAPHGLSGTEIPMFGMARELAKMGHNVSVYSRFKNTGPRGPDEPAFCDLDEPKTGCDVAIAFHDGRRLDGWPAKLKVCHHQSFLVSNAQQDATYTGADFADIYITASDHVARHLERAYGWPKVHVVPNAWDFGTYQPWAPIPGRLIYTTSLERGFHRLLEALPLIREAVPEAHVVAFERGGPMVEKLKANPVPYVTLVRASSLNAVLMELSFASCFAYPADCSSPTEVFPVSMLQACATGVPVVCAPDDGLEKVFDSACWFTPEVKKNPDTWRRSFADAVISVLKNETLARGWSGMGKDWARPLKFAKTTRMLAEIVGIA